MRTHVDGPQTPYEVFCHRCRVTHPVETRYCLHCGARVSAEPVRVGPLPVTDREEIHEGELPVVRGSRLSPIAALWLLLALGGAMYRACASG